MELDSARTRVPGGLLLRRASLWPITLTTLATFLASIAAPGIAAAQAVAEHQASFGGQSVALIDWSPASSASTVGGDSIPSSASQVDAAVQVSATNQGGVDGLGKSSTRTGPLSADNVASTVNSTGVGSDGQPLSSDDGAGETKDPGGEVGPGSDNGQGPPVGGDRSGVTSKVISVPKGAGSVQGMGESFSAQLSTGIATFSVPFVLPKARGGVQPSLGLSYSSSGGFGPAGVGWSVGVPFIARQTDKGVPSYDDRTGWHPEQDRFVFNGGQELVPICVVGDAAQSCEGKLLVDPDSGIETLPAWATGHQYFRPRVEGSFLRFFWSPDHQTWRVQDKSGTTMELGVPLDGTTDTNAVERNPEKSTELYRWHLVRQYDTYGEANPATGNPTPNNVVVYKYFQDGGTAFLSDIYDTPPISIATTPVTDPLTYAHHTHLKWEPRTDPTFSFRTGWRVEQNLRLKGVDVTSKTFNEGGEAPVPRRLVRRYHLAYDVAYHPSLLQRVQVEGRCKSPALGGVSEEKDAAAEGTDGLLGDTNCERLPPMTFDYTHVKAVRSDGTLGAADLPGYDGFNETIHKLSGSPPHSLDDAQTALFDINSDSLPDLLVTMPGRYGKGHGVFFNGPKGQEDAFSEAKVIKIAGVLGATSNDIKLSNFNVNPLDLDGDATVNLLHMPRVKTYSTYTPAQKADGSWQWLGRVIETASGQDPKIDFGKDTLETQVVDVNFDGLVDVVVSTGTELQTFLALGRYPGGDGQFGKATHTGNETAAIKNDPIRTCVPQSALPVRFSDPDIKLADMNGDGIVDIVRLRRGDIQYWPGRGNGVWGTGDRNDCAAGTFVSGRYLTMENSPHYSDIQETTLRLDDVNGDGLTDLVEVRFDEVDVWLNVDGKGWTKRHILKKTPASPSFVNRVQLVDVNGSGTRDLLWGEGNRYKYIDIAGGVRPWVLSHVDNGLGKTTDLEYSTSAQEMLAAEREGEPWTKKMPTSVHVVKRVTESENLTIAGREPGNYVTEYSYRDPVFEGRQREFRGFSSARARRLGDDNSPTDITETQFLLGECEDEDATDGEDRCSVENRWRDNTQEALKGLPFITEKFDENDTYLSTSHKTYRLRHLYTGLDGRAVRHAFEAASRDYLYDTGPFVAGLAPEDVVTVEKEDVSSGSTTPGIAPQRTVAVPVRSTARHAIITASSVVDAFGNQLRAVANGCTAGQGCDATDETITTYTVAARPSGDPTGWLWRTVQSYVKGSVHTEERHHTVTTFNVFGAPTATQATLAGTVALDRTAPGTPSSLTAIAGVRSQDGLISTGTTTYDGFGNVARSTAPNGRCSEVSYGLDPVYQQLPTLEIVYTAGCPVTPGDPSAPSLSTTAMYDRGLGLVALVTNMQGQPTKASYDQFGRLLELRRPHPTSVGEFSQLPSVKIEYLLPPDLGPTARHSIIHTSTQDSADITGTTYLESYAYIDGFGRNIVALSEADTTAQDQGDWIAGNIEEYDNKSAVRRKYLPSFYNGSPTAYPFEPAPNTHYGRQRYDAFGRQLQTFDLDGTVTLRSVYHGLSTDLYDAADLEAGAHKDTYATTVKDGHGRASRSTERFHVDGQVEARHVITQYLTTGEPEIIRRRRGSDISSDVMRWLRYDSLGRMVLNVEPNTTQNFTTNTSVDATPRPTGLKAWRYAYNDAGDLVGTSDARGCGVNFFYDAAGRLLAEDYASCDTLAQAAYTAPTGSPSLGAGIEVLYEYGDSLPARNGTLPATPPGYSLGGPLTRALLIGVHDRARSAWTTFDGRGRSTRVDTRVAQPTEVASFATRYAPRWYSSETRYDAADRQVVSTSGAAVAELQGAAVPGTSFTSAITTVYSNRGTVKTVGGSYGTLVSGIERSADGLIGKIVYGDLAATSTAFTYDDRRRVSSVQTYRGMPGTWLSPPPAYQPVPAPNGSPNTFQLLLQDEDFTYDVVNNPVIIRDWRDPAEWPAGAKPVSRKMEYDDLYRVSRIDYQHTGGDDTWTSPFAAENGGVADQQDPRRSKPSPQVSFTNRVHNQTHQYDWLGNTAKTGDDANGFYDRSLGTVTNATAGGTAAKPYQLKSATNTGSGSRDGLLNTQYDASGNLLRLNVRRNGPCLPAGALCSQRFDYQWDEVGRLTRARRWDIAASSIGQASDALPGGTPVADLRYRYDANDQRVIKTATDAAGVAVHTLYVFDSLELRRSSWLANGGAGVPDYDRSKWTEVPFLFANGVRLARVVWHDAAVGLDEMPAVDGGKLHVLFELGDHLGSTSVVLDKGTSELVERATYQGYGGTDSDYRPGRWKAFREDYRFTGKEEDVEVGLQYFGKRFLNPLLGRWLSPDPLALHAPGKADLNVYAYVTGRALLAVDPVGMDDVMVVSSAKAEGVDPADFSKTAQGHAAEFAKAWAAVDPENRHVVTVKAPGPKGIEEGLRKAADLSLGADGAGGGRIILAIGHGGLDPQDGAAADLAVTTKGGRDYRTTDSDLAEGGAKSKTAVPRERQLLASLREAGYAMQYRGVKEVELLTCNVGGQRSKAFQQELADRLGVAVTAHRRSVQLQRNEQGQVMIGYTDQDDPEHKFVGPASTSSAPSKHKTGAVAPMNHLFVKPAPNSAQEYWRRVPRTPSQRP